ncbi:hypothetical protein BST61_g11050 [Cercospora zeina]
MRWACVTYLPVPPQRASLAARHPSSCSSAGQPASAPSAPDYDTTPRSRRDGAPIIVSAARPYSPSSLCPPSPRRWSTPVIIDTTPVPSRPFFFLNLPTCLLVSSWPVPPRSSNSFSATQDNGSLSRDRPAAHPLLHWPNFRTGP